MTEKRKAEDTICPFIYASLLSKFTVNQSDKIGKFKLISCAKEIKEENLATCLGLDCQMFAANIRGCGLRQR